MSSHIGAPSNRKNYHQLKSPIHTTPQNFGKDMELLFKTYSENVVAGIVNETRQTANDGMDLLRNVRQPDASEGGTAHPMKRRQWRRYSSSWYVKEYEGVNFYKATVHNRKHYRLTHLLEYGHATRNGLRTRAFRHIEPIEIYCEHRMLKNIPEIIKKGGKK